jgi:hypothetical protein
MESWKVISEASRERGEQAVIVVFGISYGIVKVDSWRSIV